MKSFKEYLTESKKTYAFKIKLAGDLDEGVNSKLKTAMERFSIVKMGSGKRTPITEVPLDFPDVKNMPVTVFDVEVNYPTTPDVLESYIAQYINYPNHCVKVRTGNEPSEQYQEQMKKDDTKGEALLNQEDLGGDSAQDVVGTKHNMSLLKDLAKTSAERKAETTKVEGKEKVEASEPCFEGPNDGTVSPVGSKAVKRK